MWIAPSEKDAANNELRPPARGVSKQLRAMRAIRARQPQLAGVLPKTYEIFTGPLLKQLLKRVWGIGPEKFVEGHGGKLLLALRSKLL
jgi:hypothetical protein